MPATIQMIGTGITRRPVLTISGSLGEEPGPGITIYVDGPMSEEEVAAAIAFMVNSAQTSTFEGSAAVYAVWAQDVLAQAKLPLWDKYVRIYADGTWADDLPENWLQCLHDILKPGERPGRAIDIVEQRGGIDSPAWLAATILAEIDRVQHMIARGEAASAAHLTAKLYQRIHDAILKCNYEPDIELGKVHRRSSSKGGKGRRQDEEHAEWQRRANAIVSTHPKMPWGRVYRQVAAEVNKSKSTVRKYIRNPRR